MDRIGILTFHWADNFGAVLQTYALQQVLTQMGADVNIINFVPANLSIDYQLFVNPVKLTQLRGLKATVLTYASRIKRFTQVKKRVSSYGDFRRKYLRLSGDAFENIETLKKICEELDICIVGSDQVWNPDFLSLCNNAYLLPFKLSLAKKVSYAASVSCCLNESWMELFKEHLKSFWRISVREEITCTELSSIINRQIYHVLDPTLLLDVEDYAKIEKSITNIETERYLLVYNFGTDPLPIAERIAEQLNVPIVVFNKPRKYQLKRYYREFSDAGPGEFLSLVKNAEYVVTNSYHGTIFSIIFGKPFITVPHATRSVRMIELLKCLELDDRIVKDVNDLPVKHIDMDSSRYNISKEILKEKQRFSIKFLESVIGDD